MAKREVSALIETGCAARFSFQTNGYKGGDGGHGGYLEITIDGQTDWAEHLQFAVSLGGEANQKIESAQKLSICFAGDWEMRCAAEGLEWLAQQIRQYLPSDGYQYKYQKKP